MGTRTAITLQEFLALPTPEDGKYYELDEGELVVVGHATFRHDFVKACIDALLNAYVARTQEGLVFVETQFQLGPQIVRIPDLAFLSRDKWVRALESDESVCPFAPELAVEVISPSEAGEEIEVKTRQYLQAGTREVWHVFPKIKLVRIRSRAGLRDFAAEDVIESAVLPGFSIPVRRFFEK